MCRQRIEVTIASICLLNVIGETMREVPKSTLSDEVLDKAKCREAVEAVLAQPEPHQAFDRHAWLAKTKEQLSCHASVSQ